jgi:type IV pilus assembly protein PilC
MNSRHSSNWEHSISNSSGPKLTNSLFLGRRISKKQLAVYTRQMATLLKAGVPIVQALRVLRKQEERTVLGKIIETQIGEVEAGSPLSDSMKKDPAVFDAMYVNLVVAGEKSGVLNSVMDRLAHYIEKSVETTGKVKSAMAYPLVVLMASMGIVVGMLVFVVPQFEEIFASMLQGAALPEMTQWVLNVSRFFQAYWYWIIVGIMAVWLLLNGLVRFPSGRMLTHSFQLHFPAFGSLLKKSLLARFCRTLGTLLDSAVPILEALDTSTQTLNNAVFENVFTKVKSRVTDGDTLAKPMESEKAIPPVITGMIEVGETTGELPEMLVQIADTYEKEVEIAIDGITTLIEPVLILFLAAVVGFLVIALFLPIIEIMQQLGA